MENREKFIKQTILIMVVKIFTARNIRFLSLFFLISFMACSSQYKKNQIKEEYTFKEKSIKEFIKTNLFRTNKVFTIDSLLLEKEIVYIGIIESEIKVFAFVNEIEKIPQCIEVNNSLFIQRWKDKNFDAQESIKLLKKYNVLYDDTDENYFSFDPITDDKLKALDLFFCKNNSSIFKRVKSNMPYQQYGIPKIKCDK